MAKLEIERKFLPGVLPFALKDGVPVMQGYISDDPVIRVRKMGAEYFLTVKKLAGVFCEEYETDLNEGQFERLWAKVDAGMIVKTRHFVPLDTGHVAEIDVYDGRLAGFITIEVEFSDLAAAAAFLAPDWFGKEVTGDHRYSNNHLARHGLGAGDPGPG